MEFINGVKINDIEAIKKMGLSISDVAKTMIQIFSRQIFCYGFVHCDPHRIL
jgi:aarF domain-containing kinase